MSRRPFRMRGFSPRGPRPHFGRGFGGPHRGGGYMGGPPFFRMRGPPFPGGPPFYRGPRFGPHFGPPFGHPYGPPFGPFPRPDYGYEEDFFGQYYEDQQQFFGMHQDGEAEPPGEGSNNEEMGENDQQMNTSDAVVSEAPKDSTTETTSVAEANENNENAVESGAANVSSNVTNMDESQETPSVEMNVAQASSYPVYEASYVHVPPATPRSAADVLQGRNVVMFCTDQARLRNKVLQWEQIREDGPPHNKIFVFQLSMVSASETDGTENNESQMEDSELVATGESNSKKGAKNAAAEAMVVKLDNMPGGILKPSRHHIHHQPQQQQDFNYQGFMPPQGHYMPPYNSYYGQQPRFRGGGGRQFRGRGQKRKQKNEGQNSGVSEPKRVVKNVPNNSISKLYEHCKHSHLPEPTFELLSESVVDKKRGRDGWVYKRTEFTIQCTVNNKKFQGSAMNKKEAKHNAANAAWAHVGAGVEQNQIQELLNEGRQ